MTNQKIYIPLIGKYIMEIEKSGRLVFMRIKPEVHDKDFTIIIDWKKKEIIFQKGYNITMILREND